MSDRENGQARLSTVGASGELLMAVVSKDRVEGIKAKVANAREDWKSLMNNLQMREDALKVGALFSVLSRWLEKLHQCVFNVQENKQSLVSFFLSECSLSLIFVQFVQIQNLKRCI